MIMCNGGVRQVQVSYTYKQHNIHVGLLNQLSLDVFFGVKNGQNVLAAETAPRILLGELYAAPRPLTGLGRGAMNGKGREWEKRGK